MRQNYYIYLLILCLCQVTSAHVIEDIAVMPEDPVEGEEIITRFSGAFHSTGWQIETIEFGIGDHFLSITIQVNDPRGGYDIMVPFTHDHVWGQLGAGDWDVDVLILNYQWDDDRENLEFLDEEQLGFEFEVGEAQENVRYYTTLSTGWSIISFPIIPNDLDVPELFEELVESNSFSFLKDIRGGFYSPEFEFNNIPEWDPFQGYLLRMRHGVDFIFVGTHHDNRMETEIPLVEGWNMVAYLPFAQVSAEVAFNNIRDNLIMAKDDNGRFYTPEDGFNNMQLLRRRSGYLINVREEGELVWNTQEGE